MIRRCFVSHPLTAALGTLAALPRFGATTAEIESAPDQDRGPVVWVAKRATTVIPIVIAFSGDPVGDGVVASIGRPGGNVTGFSYMSTDLAAKRLELLNEAFSRNKRIGALYNPRDPATKREMEATLAAGRSVGVTVIPIAAQDAGQLDGVFQMATAENADGLIVFTHGFAVLSRPRIIELAASHRLPVLYGWRDFVDEGGLMSYGPDIEILVRSAATYVDRIIREPAQATFRSSSPRGSSLS